MLKKCEICGNDFLVYPSTCDKKKYCSKDCRETHHMVNVKCPGCGKLHKIPKSLYALKSLRIRFCSDDCYFPFKKKREEEIKNSYTKECSNCGKIYSALRSKTLSGLSFCSQDCSKEYMKGENSPFFKGGTHTKAGYKVIKINGKYKYEHREIMEKFLGRKLNKDEVVHHKDGNKLNNSIDNLELMSKREHDYFHYCQLGDPRVRKSA